MWVFHAPSLPRYSRGRLAVFHHSLPDVASGRRLSLDIASSVTMIQSVSQPITVWTLTIDGESTEPFDDLSVALDYLKGYVGTNGSAHTRAVLESSQMNRLRYASEVEAAEGSTRNHAA